MAFVVFEGLDGSGKSTLIQFLANELKSRDIKHLVTREPGGTDLGEELRDLLIRTEGEAPTPRTEILLYEASRSQHVDKKIKPTLEAGGWVICDRFASSTAAFQAGGRSISEDSVDWLNRFATDGLLPDVEVLLDITVEESFRRREGRKETTGQDHDRFELEKAEFHKAVREAYLKMSRSDKKRWIVLDASLTPEELKEHLLIELKKRGFLS